MRPPISLRNTSSRGSATVLVIVASIVIGISFYIFLNNVILQKKQILKTINTVDVDFAMNSTVDYVLYGIKQRYCFSDDGLLTNLPTSQCTLTQTGSVERLIMSEEQKNIIRTMHFTNGINFGSGVDYNNLGLQEIHRTLKVSTLSSKHPLAATMKRLTQVKDASGGGSIAVDSVKVDLYRDNSYYLPRSGHEVYIRIVVGLLDSAGAEIKNGKRPLNVTSYAVIYPREVGSFALMIANDLHLDRSYAAGMAAGDVAFHQFDGDPSIKKALGLVFKSPVFVNRDIYMPTANAYAAVTFADKVYLGNGAVKAGDSYYAPESAGGEGSRLWSESKNFGGFLKGIDNDGAFDKGLFVYGGVVNSDTADTSLMSKCIQLTNELASADFLKTAVLGAVLKKNEAEMQTYHLYFNQFDIFNPQTGVPSRVSRNQWRNGSASLRSSGGGPVLQLGVQLGDGYLSATMPFNSTLTFSPDMEETEEAIRDVQRQIDSTQRRMDYLNKKDDDYEDKYKALEMQLNRLQSELKGLQDAMDNVPTYRISVNEESSSKINLEIDGTNMEKLIDEDGNPVPLLISLSAYDATYTDGVPIMSGRENRNLTGYLVYKVVDKKLIPPQGLSSARDGSSVKKVHEDPTNYDDILRKCQETRDNATNQSFGGASWDIDFSKSTRHSWNFAGDADSVSGSDPVYNKNLTFANGVSSFKVVSIARQCEIEDSATLVTGFYTCDRLVIRPRTAPLRIIGTFIVKSLSIDPSAYKAGINWSSIYYPQATNELRQAGVLHSVSGRSCSSYSADPIWNPIPSAQDYADRMSCNVISLRAKADPFQWTAVDPDCGLLPGKSNTTCKRKLVNFFVVELAREAGGQ